MASLKMLLLAGVLCVTGCGDKPSESSRGDVATSAKTAPADAAASARPAASQTSVLFRNVRIFNGIDPSLQSARNVLVRGNRIVEIGDVDMPAEAGMTIIDGGGRTLMPGLIDMHWHTMAVRPTIAVAMTSTAGYLNLLAGAEASDTLQRGFTTVRDVGGNSFGLKRAIDEGWQAGPRIYPSGAIISVTGGHGDFRSPIELPRTLGASESRTEVLGDTAIADSPDEVRIRVREQLMHGASQIKLTAGGGVSSPHSPLDVVTFSPEELRAAVVAAGNWGTYVTAHAYMPDAIRQSVEAGVQCIEHANLMDETTAQLMANKGTWLSIQPLPEELIRAFPPDSEEYAKGREVLAGTDNAYRLAKKYKLKTAFGTDVLFSAALARRQGELLASLTKWYTPAEALTMATSTNAQLLALSGKRNPYPGRLGVIEVGAIADMILVEGDPLSDISLITRPQQNFRVIVKDGRIFKNTIR
ncbi:MULTISPECIES: amidohydrolase family protein [unclassified Lysobacter]|uniref:metal-dependent hydrolase family protein n=1 Tax=unclassified Lysobacter TaxID=2635362 RepID=UPI001C21A87C|nr:amidohydrolase family protein [Lysobacter sp. MMG2]MBU8975282.1 amidohydrolase family protein [Lysobacter sp. MMG2]